MLYKWAEKSSDGGEEQKKSVNYFFLSFIIQKSCDD